MTYYVEIPRVNGRYQFSYLIEILNQRGYKDVEYCEGGWEDSDMKIILPHLKFENEEDAVCYSLFTGRKLFRSIPKEEK